MAAERLFEVCLLPARHGDAVLLRYGKRTSPHYVLVDGGPRKAYPEMLAQLREKLEGSRTLQLAVVTHIDTDHIDGIALLMREPGLAIKDFWFNGWPQIQPDYPPPERSPQDSRGAGEGMVTELLIAKNRYRWNAQFEGSAVRADASAGLPEVTLEGGLKLTILGPRRDELKKLREKWQEALDKLHIAGGDHDAMAKALAGHPLLRGEETQRAQPDDPMAIVQKLDRSVANLSSIAFIAEYQGRRCLLLGDADMRVLEETVAQWCAEHGEEKLELQAVKLSHHASFANLTSGFLQAIRCRNFLVSTDGSGPKHPDPRCIDLLVRNVDDPCLHFNYRTEATLPWAVPPGAKRKYRSRYPEPGRAGISLDLLEKEGTVNTMAHTPAPEILPARYAETDLGLVQIDEDRRIVYANESGRKMLGIRALGVRLDELFDAAGAQTLADEMGRRRKGEVGNYPLAGVRASDGKFVEFEVTGLPLITPSGEFKGSFGIFRNLDVRSVTADLERLNRDGSMSSGEIFQSLAKSLSRLFEFEMVSVTRFSSDFGHMCAFSIVGDQQSLVEPSGRERRWWDLNDETRKFLAVEGVSHIDDLEAFLKKPEWETVYKDPKTQAFLDAGYKSALRRDVKRGNKTIGSFSLQSKTHAAYTDADDRTMALLPIEPIVVAAFEAWDRRISTGKIDLLKKLNGFTDIPKACNTLADDLAALFNWSHVSIFQVRHGDNVLQMLGQSPRGDAALFKEKYRQPIKVDASPYGVLGHVVEDQVTHNVGNVDAKKGIYVRPPGAEKVRSELAVPILSPEDGRVRYIINVEDVNEDAFSADEQSALEELAGEVSLSLARIADIYFLSECFRTSSDSVLILDSQMLVRRCNPAASQMLGYKEAKCLAGQPLADIFRDRVAFERQWKQPDDDLGELEVIRVGERSPGVEPTFFPAAVTRSFLPRVIGGAVLVLRDMREMQRRVESETLGRAAYKVAVETSTYAVAAAALVEAVMPHCGEEDRVLLDHALANITRVRDGYARLAASHAGTESEVQLAWLDLGAELRALLGDLPPHEQGRIRLDAQPGLPKIKGDYFPLRIVFDTLITPLVRCAPKESPVKLELSRDSGKVVARIVGHLAEDGEGGLSRDASEANTTADLAKTYISDVMRRHQAHFALRDAGKGAREYVVEFPEGA